MIALALCTTVAISTTVVNAFAIGLATLVVLVLSTLVVSLLRKVLPTTDNAKILLYIIVVATFTTIVQMFLASYIPQIYDNLGLFISLIAINCLIMGQLQNISTIQNTSDAIQNTSTIIQNTVGKSTLNSVYYGLIFILLNVLLGVIRQIMTDIVGFNFFVTIAGGYLSLALVLIITYGTMATQSKQCNLSINQ